jgi:hypothetical protein
VPAVLAVLGVLGASWICWVASSSFLMSAIVHVKDDRTCHLLPRVCPRPYFQEAVERAEVGGPEQGAAVAVRLATLPDDGPTGQLFDENGAVAW